MKRLVIAAVILFLLGPVIPQSAIADQTSNQSAVCTGGFEPTAITSGNRLVYAYMWEGDFGGISIAYHVSDDRGKTWKTNLISPGAKELQLDQLADPVLTRDATGTVYLAFIGIVWRPAAQIFASGLYLARLNPTEAEFSKPMTIAFNAATATSGPIYLHDRPWMTGLAQGVAIIWSRYSAAKAGETPRGWGTQWNDFTRLFARVQPNGQVEGPFAIQSVPVTAPESEKGDTDANGVSVAKGKGQNVYLAFQYDEKTWFMASANAGASFLPPREIAATKRIPANDTTLPFPIAPLLAMAVLAGDNQHPDTLFVVQDSLIQGQRRIILLSSADAGQNWQQTTLADDPNADRFLPWLTLDPATKTLYVIWLEKARSSDLTLKLKMAVSRDGGQTFSQPRELAKVPGLLALCKERQFIGDYIAAAAAKGLLFVAWPDVITLGSRNFVGIRTLVSIDNP